MSGDRTEPSPGGLREDPSDQEDAMTDRSRWRRAADRGALPVLAALTACAVVAAALLGASWVGASGDPAVDAARTRDEVLDVTQRELVQINTIDWHAPDGGLGAWQQQVTGPLAQQVAKNRQDNVTNIRNARTVTRARVLDAALTRLEPNAGRASAIAALEVTVTPDGGQPATKFTRVDAGAVRTPQGWKLESVQVVGMSE